MAPSNRVTNATNGPGARSANLRRGLSALPARKPRWGTSRCTCTDRVPAHRAARPVRERRDRELLGARPAAIIDMGWLKLHGGAEYQYEFAEDPGPMAKNTIKNRGGAGSAQFVLAPYRRGRPELRGRHLRRQPTRTRKEGKTRAPRATKLSTGGFVDVSPVPERAAEPLAGCRRQLRDAPQLARDPGRELREVDEHAGLSSPRSTCSTDSSSSRSSAATPKSHFKNPGHHQPLRRRHVQPPRSLDVPLLTATSRRAVNLLPAVPLRRRNARRAICRR